MSVRNKIIDLRDRMSKGIIGQTDLLDHLVIGLLCNGNLLVESVPGLAKTRAIRTLSKNIEGDFKRIQFTPDLRATDITGKEMYYESEKAGKAGSYKFIPGPIFANLVLADEINRAPSRVQNALLEAMEERQVTVAGVAHKMPELFMVMATQNPVEQAGTYPLPEAQKDRFLMHVSVDYPDEESEGHIIRMVRGEENAAREVRTGMTKEENITKTDEKTIFQARDEVKRIEVPKEVEDYMVELIFATRYPQRYTYELRSFIKVGVSPRASIALDRCTRAHAWLHGKDKVEIEDIHAMVKSVFRHRIVRGERAIEHNITENDIIDEIKELIAREKKNK